MPLTEARRELSTSESDGGRVRCSHAWEANSLVPDHILDGGAETLAGPIRCRGAALEGAWLSDALQASPVLTAAARFRLPAYAPHYAPRADDPLAPDLLQRPGPAAVGAASANVVRQDDPDWKVLRSAHAGAPRE